MTHIVCISENILESNFAFLGVHKCLFLTCPFCCAAYHHVFSSPDKILKGSMSSASKNACANDRDLPAQANNKGLSPGRC